MSVCEAELLEGSNCALLLESTMSMVQELLPDSLPPKMYIDNQAAGNILNGSMGSWRTRHLRIRHSYVLDRIKAGSLVVEHIAGEDQPADLPTKMHSKARLIHLLGTWGMVGLPELDATMAIKGLKLGCVFLLLLAIQSLAVEATKDPLPATGTVELFLMLMLTCISAVALWEMGKAIGNRMAAEAEVERWEEGFISDLGAKIYFAFETANAYYNYKTPVTYDHYADAYGRTRGGCDTQGVEDIRNIYSADECERIKDECVWAAATYYTTPTGESNAGGTV
ncbi:GIP [Symbiodinium sp. KB8]|nr:GIP [Symbiodinium sp. KB8]